MSHYKKEEVNPSKTLPVIEDSDNICALGVNRDGTNICMSDIAIKQISDQLKKSNIPESSLTEKKDVIEQIKKKTNCNDEICILNDYSVSLTDEQREEEKKRIKPKGPADSDKLLHDGNIDTVLSNLTIVFKDFKHMKFQMIDFDGLKDSSGNWIQKGNQYITPTELGTVDMVNDVIKKGYKTFGVVLNTDTRNNRGEHWFCLFCDFRVSPFTVEYFNSSGNKPYPQIQDWMAKTCAQIKQAGYSVVKKPLVGTMHQIDSETECGPYSLYYIYNRVEGVPSDNFQGTRITDAQMLEFRKKLFRK
jgi:hypothetical protein